MKCSEREIGEVVPCCSILRTVLRGVWCVRARERERERERGQEVAIPRHGNEAEKERYTQALRAKRRGMNAEACVEARTKGIVSARVSRAE
jgi:hypothetical protein